nr:hypothetical protein [Tanacetum cinerariifolium]
MALWKSQREDHTSDWPRTIPISSLFKGFTRDIYGDHDVSCIGKEVDIGLDEICDKPLCPADMLLYSLDKALDMCVELTRSSPLTQTEMPYFMHGHAVIDDWRLTTLPIMLSGLGILSTGDIIWYAFLASHLQKSTMHAKILMKNGIDSCASSFQHALDAFNTTCNVEMLSITTCTSALR